MKRAIYTYCLQRYDEIGSGWGFFSYSDGLIDLFVDRNQFEEQLGSQVYKRPNNKNVWLTVPFTDNPETYAKEQEAINRYHPELFSFRTVHTKAGEYSCLAYARNLGREIKNANRPSNQVVYSLIGSCDEITDYPCFYAGNEEFKSYSREYFKSKQEKAAPLEEMSPCAGKLITRESVHRFLQEDEERVEDLIILFYTLINEQSGRKRPILICDQKENIIYWIAAVTLLFPLEIAKKIEFSTYDYLDSSDQVISRLFPLCGVYSPTANDAPESRATNYDLDQLQNNENIVLFDIECVIKPSVTTNEFESIIREFCKGNEEPLYNYHRYIMSNTSYRKFDINYTFFCSTEDNQFKVFQYFNRDIQKEMFDRIYPSLYDSSESDENITQAINVTLLSMKNNVISERQLNDDITTFTIDFLRSSLISIDRYRKLEPILKGINISSDGLIKHLVLQDSDIVENATRKEPDYLIKSLYILSLLSPLHKNEYDKIARIGSAINATNNRNPEYLSQIYKWYSTYFTNAATLKSPELLIDLLSLCGDRPVEFIRRIIEWITKWPVKYSCAVIECIDISNYSTLFYRIIENDSFLSTESTIQACKILCIIKNANTANSVQYCTRFLSNLTAQNIKVQKKTLEFLIVNNKYPYDKYCYKFSERILSNYPFESVEELSEFSLLLYHALDESDLDYNLPIHIVNSLQRFNCNKKTWKKSVKNAILPFDNQTESSSIKKQLIMDVCNLLVEDTPDKGNPIKKFMERFKK